jgi:hypothetical protein
MSDEGRDQPRPWYVEYGDDAQEKVKTLVSEGQWSDLLPACDYLLGEGLRRYGGGARFDRVVTEIDTAMRRIRILMDYMLGKAAGNLEDAEWNGFSLIDSLHRVQQRFYLEDHGLDDGGERKRYPDA